MLDPAPPFKCYACSREFRNAEYYIKHLQRHVRRAEHTGGPYKCPLCWAGFDTAARFVKHAMAHNGESNEVLSSSSDGFLSSVQGLVAIVKPFSRNGVEVRQASLRESVGVVRVTTAINSMASAVVTTTNIRSPLGQASVVEVVSRGITTTRVTQGEQVISHAESNRFVSIPLGRFPFSDSDIFSGIDWSRELDPADYGL